MTSKDFITIGPLESNLSEHEVKIFRNELFERFFSKKIISNMHKWDIIILVGRKGKLIFEDLMENHCQDYLEKAIDTIFFEVNEIQYNVKVIENKDILVFDDSIHTGKAIEYVINTILSYKVKSLSISTLFSKKRTYEFLLNKYNDVMFLEPFYIFDSETDFLTFYLRYMPSYFDYICKPSTSNSIVDKFVLPYRLSTDEIINFFSTEISTPIIIKEFEDRSKINLEFFDECKGFLFKILPDTNVNLELCKVRFFVHMSSEETVIYVEYIIEFLSDLSSSNEIFNKYNNCLNSLDVNLDFNFICVIYEIISHIRNILFDNFENKGLKPKIVKKSWYFNGKLIDTSCFDIC